MIVIPNRRGLPPSGPGKGNTRSTDMDPPEGPSLDQPDKKSTIAPIEQIETLIITDIPRTCEMTFARDCLRQPPLPEKISRKSCGGALLRKCWSRPRKLLKSVFRTRLKASQAGGWPELLPACIAAERGDSAAR